VEVLTTLPRTGVYRKGELDLIEVLRSLSAVYSEGSVGAVATFLGVARSTSSDGKEVVEVYMEAYVENAARELNRIVRECVEKYSLRFAGIWHLLGSFSPGEPIVLVAALGPRRKEVFAALREMVERYKREPALFKRETFKDGTHRWVGEESSEV
jgi:molybdopterin synthase catalytic subunit